MDSTHSSAVLTTATLVPIIVWLTTKPLVAPNTETATAIAGLIIASPPAIMAFASWIKSLFVATPTVPAP